MGSKERTVKSPKTEINGKAVKPAYSRWLFKNIVAVALTLFLLKVVMVLQPTYNWVCFTMLPENMEIVRKYPNLNYDGRMSIKLGANYMYLKNTREHTPENAVILWPSSEAFTKGKSPFTAEISNKIYALRFLYPRKLVIPFEFENGILPIKKPENK